MPQDSQGRYVPDAETVATGAVASAARTATATGTAFSTADLDSLTGTLTVTVVSGTNPTMDVTLETTADGTNYYTVGAFVQKTAAATADAKIFAPLGSLSRWKWTIGGTDTPTFTFSISATANRDS
jgi:hypothetical protein